MSKNELMQAERQTLKFYLIGLFARSNKPDGSDLGTAVFVVFLPALAGQASKTVQALNSDKATGRTITNYVNNKSKERMFTP